MVVVEGATLATFVTGTIAMLIIGILLNVGLGIFFWALFALATHALRSSSAWPRGSIHFKREQVRSVPSTSDIASWT